MTDTPALSYSGLNDLIVSPLQYWAEHVNPKRERKESTPAQMFGTGLHAAVLEPRKFKALFCQRFVPPGGCLKNMDEIRSWLREKGVAPKGTRKSDLIAQAQAVDPEVPIYDVLRDQYDEKNFGKTQFTPDEWKRLLGAARALTDEPVLQSILDDPEGRAEDPFLVPYKGVHLRGKMDWVTSKYTLDLKTIARRGKRPFDEEVTSAIWNEGYWRQAYIYSLARAIEKAPEKPIAAKAPPFIFAFVESFPPFETRLREMRPMEAGQVNMLWDEARRQVESGIEQYRQLLEHFGAGEKPWRFACEIEPLEDLEFPRLSYA